MVRRSFHRGLEPKASAYLASFKKAQHDDYLRQRMDEAMPTDPVSFVEYIKRFGPPEPYAYYRALATLCKVTGADEFKWRHSMSPESRAFALTVYRDSVTKWELQQIEEARRQEVQRLQEQEMLGDRLGAW